MPVENDPQEARQQYFAESEKTEDKQPRLSRSQAPRLVSGSVILGILLVLLLAMFLQKQREPSLQSQNLNNLRQLGIALHAHHGNFNFLPLVSSEPLTAVPGSFARSRPAGYSFIVHLLPYLGEESQYQKIEETSRQFTLNAFDPAHSLTYIPPDQIRSNLSSYRLPGCVSPFNRDRLYADSELSDYSRNRPQAVNHYVALVDPYLTRENRLSYLSIEYEGSGVLVFPRQNSGTTRANRPVRARRGVHFRDIFDGLGKTLVLCETSEQGYSSWYDGQANWVVGSWPGNPDPPSYQQGRGPSVDPWSDAKKSTSILSLKLCDPSDSLPDGVYLEADRWSGSKDRRWGPSSMNTAGVAHLYIDGHAETIRHDIDPTLYLQLITRSGRE